MPFGMGFGELVLILAIVVVVFGATKLPEDGLGDQIRRFRERPRRLEPFPRQRPRPLLRRRSVRRWTVSDWVVVVAAVAAGAVALLTSLAPPR
jgi:mttA/Hcf106 family